MSRFEEFLRDEHGAAAAEMALMVPLLLILIFSGFEAGHYFYTEHQVIKAVREGSRYAGRLGFANFPCGGAANPAAVDSIQQVTRTGTVSGTEPRVSGLALSDITVTHRCDGNFTDSGIFRGTTGGAPIVLVRVETGYNSLLGAMGFMDTSAVVHASSEAVVNGI